MAHTTRLKASSQSNQPCRAQCRRGDWFVLQLERMLRWAFSDNMITWTIQDDIIRVSRKYRKFLDCEKIKHVKTTYWRYDYTNWYFLYRFHFCWTSVGRAKLDLICWSKEFKQSIFHFQMDDYILEISNIMNISWNVLGDERKFCING